MKMIALFAMAVASVAAGTSAGDTPVSKAIDLLTDLQKKITAEGAASKQAFAEASELCKDRSKDLGFAIQTEEAQIADLQADISEDAASISALGTKIDGLGADIAQNDADLKAATEIRAKESSDFKTEEKELLEVIDTLERAISILKREMDKGDGAFLQGEASVLPALDALVRGSMLSSADKEKLSALVQTDHESTSNADEIDVGAPAGAVYEGHSHGIIETLEDLLDKALTQLSDARKAETTAAHNFKMLEQSLTDETKFLNKDMSESKKNLASSAEAKAAAESDLAVSSKTLAADQQSLETLTMDCEQAAKDFEAETASREEELAAIASAIKVLNEMTGAAATLSYGLNQVSFMQRSQLSSHADLAGFEVATLVRKLARKEGTPELAQLASRIMAAVQQSARAGDDPFAKVKGLISDLITKLEEEASADASAKAYCDEELSETNAKKEEKTEEIEKLTANIDKMSAASTKLKEEIAALQTALTELAAAQAEMDKLRKEEKETYAANKADMELGLEGVAAALKTLREYYAKEDKAHEAAEGSGTSIIGMLEVVESDFSKDLASMTATEEEAQASYEDISKKNELEKVAKEQDVKYKTKESASLDKAVTEASADRANVQTELDAVNEYLAAIEEQCIAKAETYEERKKRREAEIAGLKEALNVLESETALVQQSSRRSKRSLRVQRGA